MKKIKTIFAYLCLLCVLGLGAYGLNAVRGDEYSNFYHTYTGKVLGVISSALVGASIGVMLGPIVGLILVSSASVGARKGMMLGLLAGLIFGTYDELSKGLPNESMYQNDAKTLPIQ